MFRLVSEWEVLRRVAQSEDEMRFDSSSRVACAFSLLLLSLLTPSRGQSTSTQIAISVVADKMPGPAAEHGLNKVLSALRAKGVGVEQANNLQAARGKMLIVAGGAAGSGQAAELIKSYAFGSRACDGKRPVIRAWLASSRRIFSRH